MRWFVNLLKSRAFLVGLGLILLVVLILVVGQWLAWPLIYRLLGVITVLLVCIVLLVVGFMRANRSAAAIEASAKELRHHPFQEELMNRPVFAP